MAAGLSLPVVWQWRGLDIAEEGAVRVPILSRPDVGDGRHDPAPHAAAAVLVARGGPSGDHPHPRLLGFAVAAPTRPDRYETAFVMLHKLRRAMRRPERDRIAGTVEVDEAYIGGVDSRQRGGRQCQSNTSIVVGAVEIGGQRSGRLRLAVVPDLSAASPNTYVAPAPWRRLSSPAASSSPTPGKIKHRCARPGTNAR